MTSSSEDEPSATGDLTGRVVALPETRELDRLAMMLEAEGARTWRCPMVAILDSPDAAAVELWLRALVAGRFDDVILLTGEGLRRLMKLAEQRELGLPVVAALKVARKITRGPKPARALKELGLSTDLAAAVPTSKGIIEELTRLDLRGRRVGLQLYGEEPNHELVDFIRAAGAEVETVAPYVYAPATDANRIVELIHALGAGTVDTIAFTSASQVDRLFAVARTAGIADPLTEALQKRACVAAIGPIAVEALHARGVTAGVVPEKAFVMRQLVAAIAASAPPLPPARAKNEL